ncbi:MAG: hypothetical protein ORN52_02305 [Beijerinckiaceae bacterium]|nr:hypothetical protein [Beijerinckiaceae bacterium]
MKNIGTLVSGKMSFTALFNPKMRALSKINNYNLKYFLPTNKDNLEIHKFDIERAKQVLNNSSFHQFLRVIRRFSVKNESTRIKYLDFISEDIFRRDELRSLAGYFSILLLSNFPKIDALCRLIERTAFDDNIFSVGQINNDINLALVSSVGNFGFEVETIFARECLNNKIPVVSIVSNYDNFLNRGAAGFLPTKLCVWSKYMADNAVKCGIPANSIEIIGAPSFDELFTKPIIGKVEYLSKLGLDPNKKTILYAGGVLIGQTFQILQSLIDSKLVGECNLIYRPYPHSKVNSLKLDSLINNYLSENNNIYVVDNKSLSETIDSEFSRFDLANFDFLDEKIEQLRHSDLVINHFSTIGLEACALNKPVVQIGFNGDVMFSIKKALHPSVNINQVHNVAQRNFSASKVAFSDIELLRYANEYLDNPELNSDNRLSYAKFECGYLDGLATNRLFSVINSLT